MRRAKQSSRDKNKGEGGDAADAEQEMEDDDEDAAIIAALDGDEPTKQPAEDTITRNRRKHRSVFNRQRSGTNEELGQQLQRERLATIVCGVATRNSVLRERYPEVSVPVRIQGVLRNMPKVTQQSRRISANFGRSVATAGLQKQQQRPVLQPSLPLVDHSRVMESVSGGASVAASVVVAAEREEERERTVQQALAEAKQRLLQQKLAARQVHQSIANRTVANISRNAARNDGQQDAADDEEKGDAAANITAPYVFGLGKYTPRLPLRNQMLG